MKTALVFSGGGARGAYQIGAWKALNELNMKFDIVTGTSIGSINGAMYVLGSLDLAKKMWDNLNFNSVFSETFDYKDSSDKKKVVKKYLKSITKGGLSPNNLKDNLIKCIDIDSFYKSEIDYGLTTVSYPKFKPIKKQKKDIPKDELIDYLLASSTVFPVFKVQEISDKKYVDGGFKDPVPVDLAIDMGADKLVVINIGYFKRRTKIDKKIIKKYDIVEIKPNNPIGTPLTFDSKKAKKIMKYGYNDTMKKFGKLYGKSYTFKNILADYSENPYFNTEKDYLTAIECLGKALKIDDTKIYNINDYKKEIINGFNNVEYKDIKRVKTFKRKLNLQEKIKYFYNHIDSETKLVDKLSKQYKKEYLSACYLYYNKDDIND